jgi:hypothetical protein
MGFILRTVFWLGLAMVILPPEARLGGGDGNAAVDLRDIDMSLQLHDAAYAVWTFGTEIAGACSTNPELCKAGVNLWKATVSTTEELAAEVADGLQAAPSGPDKLAAVNAKDPKKIQARVE